MTIRKKFMKIIDDYSMMFFVITYLLLGVLQFVALMAGLKYWLGWPLIIRAVIGVILAYIPIVGQVLSIIGAVAVWGWSYKVAILVFLSPVIFLTIIPCVLFLLLLIVALFQKKLGFLFNSSK